MKASTENQSTLKRDRGRGRWRSKGRGSNDRGSQQRHHQYEENQFQGRGRGRGKKRGGHHSTTYKPTDKSHIECHRCYKYDHYQSECRTNLNWQNGERTHFAEKEDEISFLMVCHVNEATQQNMWYLDTGCNNHMCGDKKAFSELDESFRNTVKFGDNSTVSVLEKGQVTI